MSLKNLKPDSLRCYMPSFVKIHNVGFVFKQTVGWKDVEHTGNDNYFSLESLAQVR